MTSVFYNAKVNPHQNMKLDNLCAEINWGEAYQLIKWEGFYMFGGRLSHNDSSNQLLIFQVQHYDSNTDTPMFSIIKPMTLGQPPPPRYSHTVSHI